MQEALERNLATAFLLVPLLKHLGDTRSNTETRHCPKARLQCHCWSAALPFTTSTPSAVATAAQPPLYPSPEDFLQVCPESHVLHPKDALPPTLGPRLTKQALTAVAAPGTWHSPSWPGPATMQPSREALAMQAGGSQAGSDLCTLISGITTARKNRFVLNL